MASLIWYFYVTSRLFAVAAESLSVASVRLSVVGWFGTWRPGIGSVRSARYHRIGCGCYQRIVSGGNGGQVVMVRWAAELRMRFVSRREWCDAKDWSMLVGTLCSSRGSCHGNDSGGSGNGLWPWWVRLFPIFITFQSVCKRSALNHVPNTSPDDFNY